MWYNPCFLRIEHPTVKIAEKELNERDAQFTSPLVKDDARNSTRLASLSQRIGTETASRY